MVSNNKQGRAATDDGIRQRAIASVKAQIDAAVSTLKHRAIELDQLQRDQVRADKRATTGRSKFRWAARGTRVGAF